MKITKLSVYQVELPLKDGPYNWSNGKSVSSLDTTVLRIDTDKGISGYGEVCPLGQSYLPSHAQGVRAGLKELGPNLIGLNPLELGCLNTKMDHALKGHPDVKSAVDIACWDILGKASGQSVCTLLGGHCGEKVKLYRTISQRPTKEMTENVMKYKKEGYTRFQLKLGGNMQDDIERIRSIRSTLDTSDILVADANTTWLPHEAMRVAKAISDLDVYIEQPCATYEECLSVREHTNNPFILDENVSDIMTLVRAHAEYACDVVNIKISKIGGLTKSKQVRDLCVSFGIAMTIEDTWGSDIVTAAIAALAHSTPQKYRFTSTDLSGYNTVSVASGGPERVDGSFVASSKPGLGIEPRMEVLGEPLFVIEQAVDSNRIPDSTKLITCKG